MIVRVVFTITRSFYPTTSVHRVSVLIFRPKEMKMIEDAYFLTWNPKISGKQFFSAFPKNFPYFLSFQEKKALFFWGGQTLSSPGGPCTTLSTSIRFFQASGQSFSVIFTPNSSSGRAECECLSYFHRFQMIFHLFMPSLVLSCSRPSNIGKPVLLGSADSDL